VDVGGLTWRWLAPPRPARGDDSWRPKLEGARTFASGGARLDVVTRPNGLRWQVTAEAGELPPLRFRVSGASSAQKQGDAALLLASREGVLQERGLEAWQPLPDGTRRPLRARYGEVIAHAAAQEVEYGIELFDVDTSLPVVVDPDLSFTVLLEPGDQSFVDLQYDATTNRVLLATQTGPAARLQLFDLTWDLVADEWLPSGTTLAAVGLEPTAFVVVGTTTEALPGELLLGGGGESDLFFMRYSPDLVQQEVVRFGSDEGDWAHGLAVKPKAGGYLPDEAAFAIVGETASQSWPLLVLAGGGAGGLHEAFVVTLPVDPANWASSGRAVILTGKKTEAFVSVAWNAADGTAVAVGHSDSEELFLLPEALQPINAGGRDAIIASVDHVRGVMWFSFLGGPRDDEATGVLPLGRRLLVTGTAGLGFPLHQPFSATSAQPDFFVAALTPEELVFSTLWGGVRREYQPRVFGAAAGHALVTGATDSLSLHLVGAAEPRQRGEREAVFSSWDQDTGLPVWGTLFGDKGDETPPARLFSAPGGTLGGLVTGSRQIGGSPVMSADDDVVVPVIKDPLPSADIHLTQRTATVGHCSPPIQLKVPQSWTQATPRVVSWAGAGRVLFRDPDCTEPAQSLAFGVGSHTGVIFSRYDVQKDGGTGALQAEGYTPFGAVLRGASLAVEQAAPTVPGSQITIDPGVPVTVAANSCYSLGNVGADQYTLSAFDENGQLVPDVLFSGSTCSTPLQPNTTDPLASFRAGPGVYTLQLAGNGARTTTTRISVRGLLGLTPDRLELLRGARRVVSGHCSAPQHVVLRSNVDGSPAPTSTPVTVLLVGLDVELSDAPDCRNTIVSVQVPAGAAHSYPFYVRGKTMGRGAVQALVSGGSYGSDRAEYEVLPDVPAKQDLRTVATFVPAGGCSAPIFVETRDLERNPSAEARPSYRVTLRSSGAGAVAFYADPECGVPLPAVAGGAQLRIPDGMWWRPFWVSGVTVGDVTITAESDSLLSSRDLSVVVPMGSATRLRFSAAPTSLVAGACGSFTVQPLDASDAGADAFNGASLASNPGGTFYADGLCQTPILRLDGTIPAAGRTFFARFEQAQATRLYAGQAEFPDPAEANVQVTAAAASNLGATPDFVSFERGGCEVVSVHLRDSFNNPTSGVVLASADDGGVPLLLGEGTCAAGTSASLSLAFDGGGARQLAIHGNVTGDGGVRLAAGALLTTVPVTVRPKQMVGWALDGGASPLSVTAGACTPLFVQAIDAEGLPAVSSAPAQLSSVSEPGAAPAFFANAGCDAGITQTPGPVGLAGETVYVRSTKAGASVLVASTTGKTPGQLGFEVLPGPPSRVALAPTSTVFVGRECSEVVTARVQDEFENALPNYSGSLEVSATSGVPLVFSESSSCAAAAAPLPLVFTSEASRSFFVTGTTQGDGTLRVAGPGLLAADLTMHVGWPAAVGLRVTPTEPRPYRAVAGACVGGAGGLRIEAVDDGGLPTRPMGPVQVSRVGVGPDVFDAPGCQEPAIATLDGPLTEAGLPFWVRQTRAGPGAVTFTNGGLAVDFIMAIDAGTPRLVSVPESVALTAKVCTSGVHVRFEDAYSNPVPSSDLVSVLALGDRGLAVSEGVGCMTPAAGVSLLFSNQVEREYSLVAPRVGDAGLALLAPLLGLDGSVPVTIYDGGNEPPVASLSPPALVLHEASDAGVLRVVATDPDWDVLSAAWHLDGGAALVKLEDVPLQLDDLFSQEATFTPGRVVQDTVFDVTVRVSDGLHPVMLTAPVTVLDTVNEPPTATVRRDPDVTSPVVSGTWLRVVGEMTDPNPHEQLTLRAEWTLEPAELFQGVHKTGREQLLTVPPVGPDGGVLTITLVAVDDRDGGSAPAVLTVPVRQDPQATPEITSRPRNIAQLGLPWLYDADGCASARVMVPNASIRWSLSEMPPGMTVNAATGCITWTPSARGVVTARLRATASGGWVEQVFEVEVLAGPVITSAGRTAASLFEPYAYDDDNRPSAVGEQPIGWELLEGPATMVVDQQTGAFTWTPTTATTALVKLKAKNAFGDAVETITIKVDSVDAPVITGKGNPQAQVGIGYVFDADNTVDVTPSRAQVQVVSGPDGFRINSLNQVTWIPRDAGTVTIELVAGLGQQRSASYRYDVEVTPPSSDPPKAVAVVTPSTAPDAPLDATLDGSKSQAGPGRRLLLHAWEPGDGTPVKYGVSPAHLYARAGGYLARLDVADDRGSRDFALAPVSVGIDGVLPPLARIRVTNREELGAGQVAVSFACDCSDPAGRPLQLLWAFGDGDQSVAAEPRHVYTRASVFRVRLVVSNGAVATTVVEEVEVRSDELRPPLARAWASRVVEVVGKEVLFTSATADYDGVIVSREWDFGDGRRSNAEVVPHAFTTPGLWRVSFRATDDDGLWSEDSVEVLVTTDQGVAPPSFTSLPASLSGVVGRPWRYDEDGRLAARGATSFGVGRTREGRRVGAPDGMRVNERNGLVEWTPSAPGAYVIAFSASNAAGTAWQEVTVDVAGPPAGCGCATGAEGLGGLLALGLWASRRRRRG
jgi:PKD repeat protein